MIQDIQKFGFQRPGPMEKQTPSENRTVQIPKVFDIPAPTLMSINIVYDMPMPIGNSYFHNFMLHLIVLGFLNPTLQLKRRDITTFCKQLENRQER